MVPHTFYPPKFRTPCSRGLHGLWEISQRAPCLPASRAVKLYISVYRIWYPLRIPAVVVTNAESRSLPRGLGQHVPGIFF